MPGTDGRPDTAESDDRELLAAHVAGDAEAFGTLFGRHRERLWAVALRTTGNPEDAADALQDALVSAFRRAGSYRGDAAVTTWLHRVVVNACLDRIRRQKVRATVPLPDTSGERERTDEAVGATLGDGVPPRDARDPADLVLDQEQRSLVARALASLPAEQRAALVLVDMHGFSVQEAAEALDCAPGTVKSRCSRGRARLAPLLAALAGQGDPEGGGRPSREPPRGPVRPISGEGGGEAR